MGHFGTWDLVVFVIYMIASVGIGVLFVREQKDLKSYFLAGQQMHWVLVSISVIAALFSGISYLGAPSEAYGHNLIYAWTLAAFVIATPVTALLFLPFFYNLKLYTAYEYLERRFDLRLRLLSSGLFIARVCLWLALAIYAPSLAIAEFTHWPVWASVLLTGVVTTAYTTLGGMKAVIWTDTMQFFVLFGGIVVIILMALAQIPGGFAGAWALAAQDGRTEIFDFSFDPRVRVTVWGAFLGGAAANLVQMATDQVSVQRYLTASSLKASQRSLWFKLIVTVPMCVAFYITGTVLYAFYQANPHLTPTLAKADRILPHFVMTQLPSPVPGLLIAAIFAATMSTVSAGINSLTTATLVDFRFRLRHTVEAEADLVRLAKWMTLFYGLLCTALVLVVANLGTLVEATNKVMGLLGGPLLGIFLLGILCRRANANGTLIGAALGTAATVAVQMAGISFMWYALAGCLSTVVAGYLASLFFAPPTEAQRRHYTFPPEPLPEAEALPEEPEPAAVA